MRIAGYIFAVLLGASLPLSLICGFAAVWTHWHWQMAATGFLLLLVAGLALAMLLLCIEVITNRTGAKK